MIITTVTMMPMYTAYRDADGCRTRMAESHAMNANQKMAVHLASRLLNCLRGSMRIMRTASE